MIFVSFIIGLLGFFILRYGVNYFIPLLPFVSEEKIGKRAGAATKSCYTIFDKTGDKNYYAI